jgi:hypothetical protein
VLVSTEIAKLHDQLDRILKDARAARDQVSKLYPRKGATPSEVLGSLATMRPWLDVLEMCSVNARRIRGMADRSAAMTSAAADDAWDKAARGIGGSVRDAGPRERYAHFNLSAFEEKVADREMRQLLTYATDVDDVARTMLRGAESIRHDLHLMVRAAQFESSLDR